MAQKSTTKKPAAKKPVGRPAGKTAAKTPAKAPSKAPPPPKNTALHRGIGAAVCLFLSLFSFIGYADMDAWFITYFCGFIKGIIGWGYYLFPPMLLVCAFTLAFAKTQKVRWRIFAALITPVFFGSLFHLFYPSAAGLEFGDGIIKTLYTGGSIMLSGGVVSGLLAMGIKSAVSIYGAVPVFLLGFVFFGMNGLGLTIPQLIKIARERRERALAYSDLEPLEESPRVKAPAEQAPQASPAQKGAPILGKKGKRRAIDIPIDDVNVPDEDYVEERVGFFNTRPRVKTPDQVLSKETQAPETPATIIDPQVGTGGFMAAATQAAAIDGSSVTVESVSDADVAGISSETAPQNVPAKKISRDEVEAETKEIAKTIEKELSEQTDEYQYPPVSLLKTGSGAVLDGGEEIALNRERLESTIRSFGVSASISGVTRGPTVTRYDLELDQGVKLSKLMNLAGDLALSLGVSSVRIAPIPDKISTVGVEVPNKLVSTVFLHDIIDSPAFKTAPSKLSFSIGKDIGGSSIVGNIAKLPHLLIAGTTGSGKSVCMNSLILSILYKASPEEVRLIMIDPKMVELGIYNGIPHLFVPVVTDPKKAAGALQWAVVEMLKRYRMFSEAGVRDLAGYNTHQKGIGEQTIPRIVVVIDELADLMLVASKEVEESICRVAQMGRASGIHLVIATQRPSADVITGLMKANIPSRIAFAVSSAMESRIILDNSGAEKLIGAGDMLYFPLGAGKPLRVQGAFVSDEEREEVINFIKEGAEVEYSKDILDQIERAAEEKSDGGGDSDKSDDSGLGGDYDELLTQAVDVIFETKQASVSMLQRRLKLGYARAARIVDQMEELGVVGPFEGSKPRQLLMTRQQWQERQSGGSSASDGDDSVSFADYSDTSENEWAE